MIREPQLYFDANVTYRRPERVGMAAFDATINLQSYPPDDAVGQQLDEASSRVTSQIAAAIREVETGLGPTLDNLHEQLDEATKSQNELAAKVHDYEIRRAEMLRAGKGPAFRQANESLHTARGQHTAAAEMVTFTRDQLAATEQRVKELKQQARQDAIKAAIAEAQAALEQAERSAVTVIIEALTPVYTQTTLLGDLHRQLESVRRRDPQLDGPAEPLTYETQRSPFASRPPKVVPVLPDVEPDEPAPYVDVLTAGSAI